MNILKRLIGYSIVPIFDKDDDPVFFDRDEKTVFVNLMRHKDLHYCDFLHSVFCLFCGYTSNIPRFEKMSACATKRRLECFHLAMKLALLMITSSICLAMPGWIFCLLNSLCCVQAIFLLGKLSGIDMTCSDDADWC